MRSIERVFAVVVVVVAVMVVYSAHEVSRLAQPSVSSAHLAEGVSALPFLTCAVVLVRSAARRLRLGVRRRKAFLAFSLFAGAGASADPGILTVDDAVAIALQSNRSVAQAVLEVKRAEERIGAARARRLPSLELQALAGTTLTEVSMTFPAGAFGTFPETGPIPADDTEVVAPRALSGNVSATLAQPLTQLHRIGLNTKLQELGRDAEREELRRERASVAAEVRKLYYDLVQLESALRAADELLEVHRELVRLVDEQVRTEVALPADALDVKARLAGQEHQIAELEGDLATGRERMNHLLGRELDQDFVLVPVAEASPEEADLPSALVSALAHRPELARARLAVEQADVDRRAKKAESIPELSLAVAYTSYVNVDLLPRNVAMAGLQLKWEVFDGGRRGKEQAEKALQLEQARTSAREAESQVRLEVAHQFRRVREARLLLEAQRLSRQAAQEKLRVATAQHRQEASLLKDVLDAQAGLSVAEADYHKALSSFWAAKADFRKALGEEL